MTSIISEPKAPKWERNSIREICCIYPFGAAGRGGENAHPAIRIYGGADPVGVPARSTVEIDVGRPLDQAQAAAVLRGMEFATQMSQNMDARWGLQRPELRAEAESVLFAARSMMLPPAHKARRPTIIYARNSNTDQAKFVCFEDGDVPLATIAEELELREHDYDFFIPAVTSVYIEQTKNLPIKQATGALIDHVNAWLEAEMNQLVGEAGKILSSPWALVPMRNSDEVAAEAKPAGVVIGGTAEAKSFARSSAIPTSVRVAASQWLKRNERDAAWHVQRTIPEDGVPVEFTATGTFKEGTRGWIIHGYGREVFLGEQSERNLVGEFVVLTESGSQVLGQMGRDIRFPQTIASEEPVPAPANCQPISGRRSRR